MAGVKGRSGRPRLSAEEHRIRGTYRADRHGPLPDAPAPAPVEPPQETSEAAHSRSAAVDEVEPPPGLSKAERKHWGYFAPLLAGARVLTPSDRETLSDYCRSCVAVEDRQRRLEKAFRKRVVDNQVVRMLDTQLRGWIARKTALATELGLTALSRKRVEWTGHHQRPGGQAPEKPKSKLAQLQEQAASLRRPVGVK